MPTYDFLNYAQTKLLKEKIMQAADTNYASRYHSHTPPSSITGNAGTATKLQNSRMLDGVSFDGSSNITHYGTCYSSSSYSEKTVSCANFSLVSGSIIIVKFSYGNSASYVTLNVNYTGAKYIYYRGTYIPSSALQSDHVYMFVYDGSNYNLIGDLSTSYSVATTTSNGLMSSTMVTKLNGIASNANNYTHPTSSGNKHIPSGGSSGQMLEYSYDGTAKWADHVQIYFQPTNTYSLPANCLILT